MEKNVFTIFNYHITDCKEVSCCCINEDNCTNSTCETDGQCYSQVRSTLSITH